MSTIILKFLRKNVQILLTKNEAVFFIQPHLIANNFLFKMIYY